MGVTSKRQIKRVYSSTYREKEVCKSCNELLMDTRLVKRDANDRIGNV